MPSVRLTYKFWYFPGMPSKVLQECMKCWHFVGICLEWSSSNIAKSDVTSRTVVRTLVLCSLTQREGIAEFIGKQFRHILKYQPLLLRFVHIRTSSVSFCKITFVSQVNRSLTTRHLLLPKVGFTLEQTMKAERGSRHIVLLFL